MAFVLRSAAGQPNFRPRPAPKADHRARAASSATGSLASGAPPTPAPAGSPSGFPLWCLPALAVAAALPMYGYTTQMKIINEARAKQNGTATKATKDSKDSKDSKHSK